MKLPPQQEAIRAQCFHPSGNFVEFSKEDIDRSISDRFLQIVDTHPHRLAIKSRDRSLTYAELNQRANQVAHAILERHRPGPEPIALLCQDQIYQITAILGVLKAGKFYVPLDVSYPRERNAFYAKDSTAELIVCDAQGFKEACKNIAKKEQLIRIDELASSKSDTNLKLSIPPDAFAYIMYTSGSTGTPKGIIEKQKNVLFEVMCYTNKIHVCVEDRLTLLHSLSFRASELNFYSSVLNGAALFPCDLKREGVHRLARWISDERITIFHSVPSVFRLLADHLTDEEKASTVRLVHLSGAPVSKLDVELWERYFSKPCLFLHRMGTTETQTVSWRFIERSSDIPRNKLPLGWPPEGKHVLILDENGNQIGSDQVGEIALKSRYISLGYWNQPEATKSKFIPAPDTDKQIYLTGDLGYRTEEFGLFHLGRKDFQVKIRGHRIELSEIEAIIAEHIGVKEVAVLSQETNSGEIKLIAYIVPFDKTGRTINEPRRFLKTKLPEYMIPSAFVYLDALPLTPNGKLDRIALPKPDGKRSELGSLYLLPRNEIERKLVRIWEDVLDVRPVGVNDGFFDLGGDSLSASRVISQVIKHFQLEIPLQALFQSATIADMASLIAQHQRKKSADEKLVQSRYGSSTSLARENCLLLSFSQQRLWFLNQLEPESPVYNERNTLRLEGRLNVGALQRAVDKIVERHEVLRTTYVSIDGKPAQIIHKPGTVPITLIDLRDSPIPQRKGELHRLLSALTHRSFDLEKNWPIRTALIRLGEEDHVLLFVTHHIATDGWSSIVLFSELSALYEAYSQEKDNSLKELPIQYADYAVWQRKSLAGEVLEKQLAYWRKQLDGISPLELPTDRPRQAVQGHAGRTVTFTIPSALAQRLKELSRDEKVTLFMTLLAAFQTLLYRYTGQDDIAVGTPTAGRTRVEVEGLIGFFVNTLVLRNDLSGNPTFKELLGRVKANALNAYGHQDLPFDKLVEELQPERILTHNPFFQVMFQLRNYPKQTFSLGDLTIEEYGVGSEIAKFDLTVALREETGELSGTVEYRTELFDLATIERMTHHYLNLLEGVVADPDRRLSDLPLLTEAETYKLLIEWNDPKTEYPKDKCIHQLFEEQVERTPEAIAIVFEGQQMTYDKLNRRSNQLAHYLRKLGVGRETLVGICVQRSVDMVVGLLGILKAGGAYVPLDPHYPVERLRMMLEDTAAKILLTQEPLLEHLSEFKARILCLDGDWHKVQGESEHNTHNQSTSTNLAYVMYTSGSTGKPNAVAIRHEGIVRLVIRPNYVNLSSYDVIAQLSNFAFDASTFEIWGALVNGARLVVLPNDIILSPTKLAKALSQQITCAFLTTALFNRLSDEMPGAFGSLSYLLFGGETCDPDRVKAVLTARPPKHLIHVYGPTETTTFATFYEVSRVLADRTVPIGRPIAATEVILLDSCRQLVPRGVIGEIYIGGPGVAAGYINNAQETEARFVPHPFRKETGERIYKTGDLARWLPDGNLEFLCRIDHQVKIRGFRIELGEIEGVLRQHGSVENALVTMREDSPGDKRLVAYLVSMQKPSPSVSELRGILKQKLPDYMVPSNFVFLDTLPLTPNGKLDRRALPAPDDSRPELEENYLPPRNSMEQIIAEIWADALKVEKVGVRDNFFDLGGHSLLAAQLISRMRDAFRIELPLRVLFQSPTVEGLARHLKSDSRESPELRALPIAAGAVVREYPVSFAQEQFWLLEQLQPNDLAYHVTYGFRLSGPLDKEALAKAISELVKRHESLRTTFHQRKGDVVQVISEQWSSPLKIIDLSQHPLVDREAEVRRILQSERQLIFDLSHDLLMRASLLQLGVANHVVIFNTHHITLDHWCSEILFTELAILYRAYSHGESSPLPDPPIQYRHYALWQRRVLDGAELEKHLRYWKEQLKDVPHSLNLPLDHPRKILHNRRGGRQTLVLPEGLTTQLKSLSRQSSVTLFMLYLAAFQTLLHRLSGQDDIVVGTPVAGRDRAEVERLIGVFLNTLALRTSLSGNPTFVELLARVREVALGAYEHQDLPFEKLIKELQPERDPTRTPMFQVFINLYNFKETTFQLDQLSVERIYPSEVTPQFDISLVIREHDDGAYLTFIYDSDLFDFTTISRVMGNLRVLLESIVSDPEQRLSNLPILTKAERHQLLVEWNDTNSEYPENKSIHELFEEQVERTPDADAVIFEAQRLTYRELNCRSNQLARYLKNLGVGQDSLVGISLERSMELIVALLAIFKAGGAYVPLDPSYPKERLANMLNDSRADVLVTQASVENHFSSFSGIHIAIDRHWDTLDLESKDNFCSEITANNLAYVIYTSGSTGKPNAVMVEHRSLVNYLNWVNRSLLHDGPDNVPMVSRLNFDGCLKQLFAPLLRGGQVRVLSDDVVLQPAALLDALSKGPKMGLNCVPSLWASILDAIDSGQAAIPAENFTTLFLGGERLGKDLVQRSLVVAPHLKIWNLYGPTETTANATAARIHADGGITIGQPIANAQIYILDPSLNPVPIGILGELYIGGVGLARGYLNRPNLTAEKFIPNPFSDEPGRRLYKTGDLACYMPNGHISFLGRIDNQVKIRGFRIELGEIEATLRQHPSIRDSVVLVRGESPEDRRLVAYVVGTPGTLATTNLRKYLQQKLPEYMVPSVFVVLESLPLTPNGKVDRKGLPVPDTNRPYPDEMFVAPRTPTEKLLAEIWKEVLRVDKVGIHDNFFELGGHSLLATLVVSRAREALHVELPLRSLFEYPTIAGLVAHIAEGQAESASQAEMTDLLNDLESLSDDDAQRLLNKRFEKDSKSY
jgi:amino acid adenylation domain-containing protein